MACVRRRRGRWVVDFRDQDGNRRWETFETRKQADNALSERVKQLKRGTYHAPAELPTFKEVAGDWLATKAGHRVSSYAQWQAHLDLHLLPALGPLRLDQIRVEHIEAFREDRRRAGLAPQTVNKLLTTAAAVFKYAGRRELIDRNPAAVAERCRRGADELSLENPEQDAAGDRSKVRPDEVLSPQEAARLVAEADPGFFRTYFLASVLTGARVGELTALTWDDVDLTTGTIAIRRSVSWARVRTAEKSNGGTKPRFYEPKTRSSRRTVPLAPELLSALKRWKLACPKGPLNLVFPTEEGTPKHRSTITHRGLRPALKRAGLRKVTLHSLRHSFASALIMQGSPVTEVGHLLGHSSPTVTLSVYSHWFRDVKTDAVATLAKAVCGESGSKVVASASGWTSRKP